MTLRSPYTPEAAHLRLGNDFFDAVEVADFPKTQLRFRNQRWAERVGLGQLSEAEWLAHFGRFKPLRENLQSPLALRYHGHQFRSYNPDIGDGRGFLFAQLRDDTARLLDLGTKGSGQTPYSRSGDGRLTLKGAVREILATELLEARGVNTSKTFSVIETGEDLHRHDEPSPTRSAVLVRLNHSHIRFGTFQYLAFNNRHDDIRKLIDHAGKFYFPALIKYEGDEKIYAFYKTVIENSATLAAQWMAAGFVHGVLNTDNMNITGESFDYGPWRFLPRMDPAFTAAYFDHNGLYAYGRQPEAVAWNLAQLGGTLLPVFADGEKAEIELNNILQNYGALFQHSMMKNFAQRFGLLSLSGEAISKLTNYLHTHALSLEQVMFDWYGGALSQARASKSPYARYYADPEWKEVESLLGVPVEQAEDNLTQAYFQQERPVDMVIEQMEALWAAIAEQDDWHPLNKAIESIRQAGAAYNQA